ncbi:hypothetical protein CYJ81_07265 [Lactobacillus crispatus]|uniref:Uncharacterized protein n=1 Tax=Lactobacillus crispatus TaxID=47770 RepID=A0A2I1WJE7_9LACO|nr:hypothetical protein [Lactobacillus crispatus]PEG83348.1 hypothetical protein CP367_03725 [Lactobacillus sp. UMNPBX16]PEG85860.1 hypothetical protein CP366_00055 [Lactobacillus sp. UMNPBX15]PEG99711.1 hypothetical protein CP359_00615 [Lactobacillus sp. UMNPBX8]PLA30510.1 hypothetical protein CYJ80_03750 [Lactobacillus crispatus]
MIDKLKCIKLTDQTIRRGSWQITTESEYCLVAGSIFAAMPAKILNIAGSTSVIMLCLDNSDFFRILKKAVSIDRLFL